jgi:hypothetical protein
MERRIVEKDGKKFIEIDLVGGDKVVRLATDEEIKELAPAKAAQPVPAAAPRAPGIPGYPPVPPKK